jgi:hypothetical protein
VHDRNLLLLPTGARFPPAFQRPGSFFSALLALIPKSLRSAQFNKDLRVGCATHKSLPLYEVDKVMSLPEDERPAHLVFLVVCNAHADTRRRVRARCAQEGMACHFWTGAELDEKVKKHGDILAEFFSLPAEAAGELPAAGRLSLPPKSICSIIRGKGPELCRDVVSASQTVASSSSFALSKRLWSRLPLDTSAKRPKKFRMKATRHKDHSRVC